VYHWVKADRQQGARALKAKKQGRRTSSRLAGEQAATVVRLIQTLADEMGIRTDAQAGTSSSKQGQTPVVKDTEKRLRCNLISTLTHRGNLSFQVFSGNFKSEVMIEFLRRLIRQTAQPNCSEGILGR
jgi:hypothetical protein